MILTVNQRRIHSISVLRELKKAVVAVSTYMASEHDNRQIRWDDWRPVTMRYCAASSREKIICYVNTVPEMQGNIAWDYEI